MQPQKWQNISMVRRVRKPLLSRGKRHSGTNDSVQIRTGQK
uniref:Uncharacterized protein n=1 Tax=Anguilla anguilla TaxID=7936 RepID=A0A0E9V4W5_ANGAN